jgi:hypothetical protein
MLGIALATKIGACAGFRRKLTAQVEDDLVLMLSAGVPIAVAARAVNVSGRSVERWLQGELRQRVAEARARGQAQTDAASEAAGRPDFARRTRELAGCCVAPLAALAGAMGR